MTIEAGNTMVPQSVEALPSGWLVLDLEVWKDRSGIRLAAYLWERGEHRLEPPQGESNLTGAQVRELVDRVRSATVVMGHNIRAFDVRILFGLAKEEDPAGLADRICDTLELSSLFRVGKPTHRLEKLYKLSQSNNDPLEDCWESYELYQDIKVKLLESPDNVPAEIRTWLYRLLPEECFIIQQQFFAPLEQEHIPYAWEGLNVDALQYYLETLADQKSQENFGALVFLAWLSTYGSDQDHRPGWTDHTFLTFQEAAKIAWSFSEKATLLRELEFFFGFKQFKAGQQEIAEALLQNDVVPLGVLPTGAGKSLCFQLPALIFSKIWGGLTVVVSPLQALMADQVSGLRQKLEEQKRNEYVDRVDLLVANQEPDEQKKILERLNNGQIDLIYLSPERLRHPLVREILIKRRPHLWVLDEAHTLSQWGHDFRPDFLRITTGIKDMYRQVYPQGTRWGFVTATATVKVVSDIQKKVKEHLEGVVANEFSRLPRHGRLFSWREEIQTAIESQPYCSPSQLADSDRLKRSAELIDQHFAALKSLDDSTLPPVAIIYVPTRKAAEQCAKALSEMQFQLGTRSGERFKAEPYHGGRKSADKKATITAFQKAELDVVVATNAFGMGIDRSNIHLVIHLAPPQTPEAYIQEIGRLARKEGEEGFAYLFMERDGERDFDWIFKQDTRGRISPHGLKKCWEVIKTKSKDKNSCLTADGKEFWVSSLDFQEYLPNHDADVLETQTRVALFYLEQAGLIKEKESVPCSLEITLLVDLDQATDLIQDLNGQAILAYFKAGGFSRQGSQCTVDIRELALISELGPKKALSTIRSLVDHGILEWAYRVSFRFNGNNIKAIQSNFAKFAAAKEIIEQWDSQSISLSHDNDFRVNLAGNEKSKQIKACLQLLSLLKLAHHHPDEQSGEIVEPLLEGGRYTDWLQQAVHKVGTLLDEIEEAQNLILDFYQQESTSLKESTLLNLAKLSTKVSFALVETLEIMQCLGLVSLGNGASQYSTLHHIQRISSKNWSDRIYQPLEEHYNQRRRRIYALQRILSMAEAKLTAHEVYHDICYRMMHSGDVDEDEAMQLREAYQEFLKAEGDDQKEWEDLILKEYGAQYLGNLELQRVRAFRNYFLWSLEEFDRHYLQDVNLSEPPSVNRLIQELNPEQLEVVTDDKSRAILVLAGPGVGKTRVIVYRIFYLVRSRGVAPEKILAIAYSGSAVGELRKRLYDLLGSQANSLNIMTFHGLARHLTGLKESDAPNHVSKDKKYDWLLEQLQFFLKNDHPGYQYILIDEFQDITEKQYKIVQSLAQLDVIDEEAEQKSFLVAVGDDDQNLYEFNGANIEFIQSFERYFKMEDQNSQAKKIFLLKNYRSDRVIVEFANKFIETCIASENRLKSQNTAIYPHSSENGQIVWGLYDHIYQASFYIAERIKGLQKHQADLAEIAVLAHKWDDLRCVQHLLRKYDIPYQLYNSHDTYQPSNSLIGQRLLERLASQIAQSDYDADTKVCPKIYIESWRTQQGYSDRDPAWAAFLNTIEDSDLMSLEDLYYVLRQTRPVKASCVVLSTFHSAKGSEFNDVFILDTGKLFSNDTPESYARLLYVGFTRAKQRLNILIKQDVGLPQMSQVFKESSSFQATKLLSSMSSDVGVFDISARLIQEKHEIPKVINYDFILNPLEGMLFLTARDVFVKSGQLAIDLCARKWHNLNYIQNTKIKIYLHENPHNIVCVLSGKGTQKFNILVKGTTSVSLTPQTIVRVERDEAFVKGNRDYPGDHHFIVVPKLLISYPSHLLS